jgi:hypothetical protein
MAAVAFDLTERGNPMKSVMIVYIPTLKTLSSELALLYTFLFLFNVYLSSSYKPRKTKLRQKRTKFAHSSFALPIAPKVSQVKKKVTSVFEDVLGRGDCSLLRKVYTLYNIVYICVCVLVCKDRVVNFLPLSRAL